MDSKALSFSAAASTRVEAKPSWVAGVVLRAASLGVAYGLWRLSRWLYVARPVELPLGVCLLIAASLACAFFLLLGMLASDAAIRTVWKVVGKGLLAILMFT